MAETSEIASLGMSSAEVGELEAMLAYRERQETEASEPGAEPMAGMLAAEPSPQAMAAAARVSPAAFRLIVDYETGGRPFYERIIKARPIWPEASSGVTIGFGYDLGYVDKDEYRRDWAALISTLSSSQRAALENCVGHHAGKESGATMKALIATVRDIVVSWEVSQDVFKAKTLPKYALLTENAVPNTTALNGDCFGTLVSLTFNRGASYSLAHNPAKDPLDRYREMRAIKAAMASRAFADIPGLIKKMIRIWQGTKVEEGMKRRRNDEAMLFLAGLAAGQPEADAAPGVSMSSVPLPPDAQTTTAASDEEAWTDVTEDDIAAAAVEGLMIGISAAGATWAADAVQPDYAHLGSGLATGVSFTLTGDDLARLATLNDFNVGALGEDTPVLFGLRGAGIVKDHTDPGGIVLLDQRPDHALPRCVIGVWDRKSGKVSVFTGSTVPNQAAVNTFKTNGTSGNLLSTGLYEYVCGAHTTARSSTPGAFLLRTPDMAKRVVIVRRSRNDLTYQKTDIVDRCGPGDNIHPAFFSRPTGFSSFGCQTVIGNFSGGVHSGPWASFRKAAGFTDNDGVPGKQFLYMLLTGAEARIASRLRLDGLAADSVALRRLRRLRYGSRSDAARRLQVQLKFDNPDGAIGPFTAESLHRFQSGQPGAAGSDGIFTPDMDAALGWGVFGTVGV